MKLSNNEFILEIPKAELTEKQIEMWDMWIWALKSGEYKQDKSFLRTANGYCCLGVACDLVKTGSWHVAPDRHNSVTYSYTDDDGPVEVFPSYKVSEVFGFDPQTPVPITVKRADVPYLVDIASINDRGASFEDIANILELAKTTGYKYTPPEPVKEEPVQIQ